jgi:hypothetical protein
MVIEYLSDAKDYAKGSQFSEETQVQMTEKQVLYSQNILSILRRKHLT